ncbi:MAG: hypothetical protein IPI04_09760 [Ignavibacteria bacterium]|nr:hypothetical protein [Ignavibacteria bacterium]
MNAFSIRRLGTRCECVPNQEIGNERVNSLNALSIRRLGTRGKCVPNQEIGTRVNSLNAFIGMGFPIRRLGTR